MRNPRNDASLADENHCADQAVGDSRSPTPRSNGTAKIEILGGSMAEPHTTIDSLDDSFGVEEYP